MAQGDRQKYISRRDQLVEQVIRRQVTIASGAEGVIEIVIPNDANVFLKGVGYDYFGTAIYKLIDSHRQLHKGTNQIGSVALPQQWSVPFFVRGKLQLYIMNSTGASQDYTAVFILHTDVMLDVESQGTTVALPVAGAFGAVSDVRIYGQDSGGTDHVIITDANGNLVVQLEASPTIDIGEVTIMANLSGTDTKLTATTIGSDTALDVNVVSLGTAGGVHAEDTAHTTGDSGVFSLAVQKATAGSLVGADLDYAPLQVDSLGAVRVGVDNVSGAAISATNPLFTRLTDGTAVISSSNPLPVTSNIPSVLLDGSISSTADAAVALGSAACREITVQAAYANTTVMYVGNASSQTTELYPGDSIDLNIDNISKVYIRRVPAGANVTANYIGG